MFFCNGGALSSIKLKDKGDLGSNKVERGSQNSVLDLTLIL